jgi:hypothetical protein
MNGMAVELKFELVVYLSCGLREDGNDWRLWVLSPNGLDACPHAFALGKAPA